MKSNQPSLHGTQGGSDSAGGTYASDLDGRLTARPGQSLTYDALGRLTEVRDGSGAVISTYTYDPADRLATAVSASGVRRFRYHGLGSTMAGALDGSGAIRWQVGRSAAGEIRADWASGGAGLRYHGTNGHRDRTWTADATGAVTATLRSDPFGVPGTATGGALPEFRFQGAWYDAGAGLSFLVSRWYAPELGRFISEDSLLGEPARPPSRHRYAYGEGEPVGRWDPDGRWAIAFCLTPWTLPWCFKLAGDTVVAVAGLTAAIAAGIWIGSAASRHTTSYSDDYYGSNYPWYYYPNQWSATYQVDARLYAQVGNNKPWGLAWERAAVRDATFYYRQRGLDVRFQVPFNTPLWTGGTLRLLDACAYVSVYAPPTSAIACFEAKSGLSRSTVQKNQDLWIQATYHFPINYLFGPGVTGRYYVP